MMCARMIMIHSAYDVFIPHRTRSSKKQVTRGRALGVLEAPGAAVSLGRSSLPRQPGAACMIDFRARRATAAPPYLNEIAAASQVVKPSYVNGLAGQSKELPQIRN